MPQKRTTTLSENGVAGFLFTPQWAWVHYPALELVGDDLGDDPAYHGFAVKVLTTLNGYKAREHDVALRDFLAVVQKSDVTQSELDLAEDAYLRAIAWRVCDWNWREANIDGDVVAVPAPGAALEEHAFLAFFILPVELRTWVVRVVRQAVRPKVTIPRSSSAGATARLTPPSTPPAPAPPPS